jgi:hypothetical protein
MQVDLESRFNKFPQEELSGGCVTIDLLGVRFVYRQVETFDAEAKKASLAYSSANVSIHTGNLSYDFQEDSIVLVKYKDVTLGLRFARSIGFDKILFELDKAADKEENVIDLLQGVLNSDRAEVCLIRNEGNSRFIVKVIPLHRIEFSSL